MDSMMLYSRVFMLDQLPAKQQGLYSVMPAWVDVVHAMEVFGGMMGALALLYKKKWAFILFCVSLIGVLAQSSYLWFVSDAIAVMGYPAILMPMVGIVFGIVMIVISRSAITKGWLK